MRLTLANVCSNPDDMLGSVTRGTFSLPSATNQYFSKMFPEPDYSFLYFFGYATVASVSTAFLYKANPDLSMVETYSLGINVYASTAAADANADFAYVQKDTSNSIYEIDIKNYDVTREITIPSSAMSALETMEVNDYLYFTAKFSSVANICRLNLTDGDYQCLNYGHTSISTYSVIGDESVFLGLMRPSSNDFFLLNANFSDPTQMNWFKAVQCPTGACSSGVSRSIVSRDGHYIYTMILYRGRHIFQALSVADGEPLNLGLMDTRSTLSVISIEEFSEYVIALVDISSANLISIYLIDPATRKVAQHRNLNIEFYQISRVVSNGYEYPLILGGDTNVFMAKSVISEMLSINGVNLYVVTISNITSTAYSVENISSVPSLVSSTGTASFALNPSAVVSNITTSLTPSLSYSIALWKQTHVQSVIGGELISLNFTWACAHSSNVTAIAFALNATGTTPVPSWVELDSANQKMYLNKTPVETTPTIHKFSLKIQYSGGTSYKKFEITVQECGLTDCLECDPSDSEICIKCISGFSPSTDGKVCVEDPPPASPASPVPSPSQTSEKEEESPDTTTEQRMAQSLIAASMIISVASSILSLSSLSGIFSMINSLQLLILLPLVPEFFSKKVMSILTGVSFTMLSFDFIKVKDIPLIVELTEWVSYPQSDEYLNEIGLNSGSSVINYLSIMAIAILIGFIHLCIAIGYNKVKEKPPQSKIRKVMKRIFIYFTFNAYIRIFIEGFLFVLISIFSEFYSLNVSTVITQVSLGFCVMFTLCSSVLFILSFYLYKLSFPKINYQEHWSCTEYFEGIKDFRFAKLFTILYLSLRLFLVAILINGRGLQPIWRSVSFVTLNVLFALYLCIVRPFEQTKDSIIEGLNQVLLCVLSVPLLWIETRSDWSSSYEEFYIKIVLLIPAIGSLIGFVFLIKIVISKFVRRKKTRKHKLPETLSVHPKSQINYKIEEQKEPGPPVSTSNFKLNNF
ncbi:unnamed protein product [Moneuplotes crassus]|uniref:Uncharacterized protein n=1 Tax=Euplotes crassus TaxID=5936 RepID=A0AAD2D487_EUPCR|nr:unnamed protein product [Moneuplotes crassus]